MCIYHLYVVLIIHMGHTFCYEMYNCMNINVQLAMAGHLCGLYTYKFRISTN